VETRQRDGEVVRERTYFGILKVCFSVHILQGWAWWHGPLIGHFRDFLSGGLQGFLVSFCFVLFLVLGLEFRA
jgi:hypothetical protein